VTSSPPPDRAEKIVPRHIVVPLDRSPLAERALVPAAEIARRTGALIRLVHVRPGAPALRWGDDASRETESAQEFAAAREYLARVALRLSTDWGVDVGIATLRGRVPTAICADAAAAGADLIVMSTHGRTGWSRFWIGSVADAVLHRARVPVLLVRGTVRRAPHQGPPAFAPARILVPVDGAPECDQVLRTVAGVFGPFHPTVELLEVVAPMEAGSFTASLGRATGAPDQEGTEATMRLAQRYLARAADRLSALQPSLSVTTTAVIEEPATHAIVDAAGRADVVAIVSHGRGVSRLLVGSVCDKLLQGSTATLLVFPPSGGSPRRIVAATDAVAALAR